MAGKMRSPNYPAIGLTDAVNLARKIWDKEKRTAAAPEALVKAWSYTTFSGPARVKIGAMKKYGLLEDFGSGLRLSDLGMNIIHNEPGSGPYMLAVREAALKPELFQELYRTHIDGSEDAVKSFLVLKKAFSDAGARQCAAAFLDTISIAKLKDSDYTEDKSEQMLPVIAVGDFVQWESQGALRFAAPRRVRALSEDGAWGFVDGSNAGVPIKELTVVANQKQSEDIKKDAIAHISTAPKLAEEVAPGMKKDVFSLDEGDITIQWPAALTEASFHDVTDWLDLLKRKIGRSVVQKREVASE